MPVKRRASCAEGPAAKEPPVAPGPNPSSKSSFSKGSVDQLDN